MSTRETIQPQQRTANYERIGLLVLAAVLAVAPLVLSNAYQLNVLVLMAVNAILATGLAIVVRAGRLSLAQASFGGIGGYTTGILTTTLGMPFWLALPAGGLLAAAIGVLLGLTSLRLRGFYFAIATFTFSQLAIVILRAWTSVTGGMSGMFGLPFPTGFLGLDFSDPRQYYYLVLVVLFLAVAIYHACSRGTAFGRGLAVLGEDEVLASSLGVPATRYRLLAFALSSGIGGIGGSFGAHFIQGVSPSDIAPIVSVFVVVMVLAGGAKTLVGPLIGAIILTLVPELLRASAQWSMVFYGVFLLLYVYLFPDGLLPLAKSAFRRAVGDPPSGTASHRELALVDAATARAEAARQNQAEGQGADSTPIIALENASCAFGALKVLHGLDWSVRRGCINGLIGPNGAGKTTFFNVLTGVAPVTEGTVRWHGAPVVPVPGEMVRRGMSRTFQHARVFEDQTVADSILLAAELSRRAVPETHLGWALSFFNLTDVAFSRGRDLTHYQRRLTSIAMAMASSPELLLLDEPLAGLDDTETRELSRKIAGLQQETGNTILLIEHKLSEVMELCDTLTVLDHGVIIATGTPDEVSRNSTVIEAYLGNE
ncbi:MAG: hypothetical protein CML29_06465 [Rhizobiales bacterium]|nr:hypothetical protein [Hyphomicrobiales bacterium]MBA68236.1 hypothetical protein [Hyphomicrobiales bacterium]